MLKVIIFVLVIFILIAISPKLISFLIRRAKKKRKEGKEA